MMTRRSLTNATRFSWLPLMAKETTPPWLLLSWWGAKRDTSGAVRGNSPAAGVGGITGPWLAHTAEALPRPIAGHPASVPGAR